MMPYQPVQELYKGWMEKKGEVGSGSWKTRYFVLLSNRRLQYYESESSGKPRGAIELASASAVRPIPDEYYNYDEAIEIVTGKRRWILCPTSKKDQQMWLEMLLPVIGGELAADGEEESGVEAHAPLTAVQTRMSVSKGGGGGGRVRGVSMVVGVQVSKRGWLSYQEEDGGEWLRRYFVLEERQRDGQKEASVEYYLDEDLTPDVDAETIELSSSATIQTLSPKDGSERSYCMQLTTSSGAMHVLSADSLEELTSWKATIEAAIKGKGAQTSSTSSPSPAPAAAASSSSSIAVVTPAMIDVSSTKSAKGLGSIMGVSSRKGSVETLRTASTATDGGAASSLPEISLAVHSGWLTKKGGGIMAKSQQRWCVLYRTGEVHYFEKQWSGEAQLAEVIRSKGYKGCIQLQSVTASDVVRAKPSSTSDFTFYINTPKRKWVLTAPNEKVYEEWRKQILSLAGAAAGGLGVYTTQPSGKIPAGRRGSEFSGKI